MFNAVDTVVVQTNMAEKSDGVFTKEDVFSLSEFVECYDLPKWVEVVGGKDATPGVGQSNDKCNIKKGMLILLRTLAVDSVTLSFNDVEVGKRIVNVSPNTRVKFNVMLPFPDFKHPKAPRTVYKTVVDLLKVCPTFFKANIFYDDPYLPAIVKSGEVFRFIRQIKHPNDRRVYLQCKDSEGNVIELPSECRGDFTAEEDHESYTLKELLDLGSVDRKLKLCRDHIPALCAEKESEDQLYSNVSGTDSANMLHRIMGLPLTYDGFITLHRPTMFLAVSPSDRQSEVWKVPLSMDIQTKPYVTSDYEEPTAGCEKPDLSNQPPPFKMYKLSEMLDIYHEDFPVLATLVHYRDMPDEFRNCIEPGCELIVHNIERHDRLLAKSGKMHFSIDRSMHGRFRKTLRRFKSLVDIKEAYRDTLNEDLYVKILQDIASDSPVPFSLLSGDTVRFKTLQTKQHKVKVKSKTFGPFPVINCEKRKPEKGTFEKILLPEDLEVWMHELPSASKAEGFSVDDVFRYRPELPLTVDYMADYMNLWSCLPISSEITITNFVSEPLAVISPVPNFESPNERRHIDYRVRDCLLVPARHHVMLTVKECLSFPPNYFMFPDKNVFIECPVEKISHDSYEELVRTNDLAYEDYIDASPTTSGSDILLPRSKSEVASNDIDGINKRLSRSLSNMFKGKGRPAFLNKMKRRKASGGSDQAGNLAMSNDTYQPGSIQSGDSESYDDENIYEHVDITGKAHR